MPAPTNTDITTAQELGTLPVLTTQDQTFAGTTYSPLWYQLTVPTGVNALGVFIYGNFGDWNPLGACYRNLASPELIAGTPAGSRPLQIAVTPGETIYISSTSPGVTVTPALTTIDVIAGPALSVPVGSILINDSGDGFPLVALSATDGSNLAFVHPFPAGESCRVLTTGQVMVADSSINGPRIYQGTTLFDTPVMPASGYELYGTDQTTGWWCFRVSGGQVYTVFVSKDGTVSGTVYNILAGNCLGGTPNLANTCVYVVQNIGSTNQPIKKVTIPGLIASDFVAGVANYTLRPGITTLLDDTVLCGYSRSGVANEVRRFSTLGVLTDTYSLGADTAVEQIFTALDDPVHFWVWTTETADGGGLNRFRKIKVSDGTVTVNVTSVEFINAVSQPTPAIDNTRFGSDFSCVPWIARSGVAPAPTTFADRRLRQFLLPSSPDNRMLFLARLELLCQTGIGLPEGDAADPPVQGSDPQVMMQLSRDGGATWSPERWMTAGKLGEYTKRVRWLRNGRYRNAVCRIVVSDPVDWQFLAMSADIDEGSS